MRLKYSKYWCKQASCSPTKLSKRCTMQGCENKRFVPNKPLPHRHLFNPRTFRGAAAAVNGVNGVRGTTTNIIRQQAVSAVEC